jgi:hypothetical protein
MKRGSILTLFIFLAFIVISSSAISQETDQSSDTDGDHVIMEDTATEHADKVYDNDNVKSLKAGPVSYSDGYQTFINDKVQIHFDDIDNIMTDKVFYRINDGTEREYTGPFTLNEEGSHVIYYYGVDRMGNKERVRALNVVVDMTPPETVLTVTASFSAQGNRVYASDNFTYSYTINSRDAISGVASVTYSVNGGEYVPYLKPFTINSTTPVKLDIISVDRVGNSTTNYTTRFLDDTGALIADNFANVQVVIDNTPPTVKIIPDREFFVKDGRNIASRDYKFTITAEDDESGVKGIYYRLDNMGEFVLYTGEIQFYTNGMHKIEAIARDGVGNTSRIESLDFYVDTIPTDTNVRLVTE